MIDNSFISDKAKELIFNRNHNFKSIGQLYGYNQDQVTYRLKKLREDPDFNKKFGKKNGDLSETQKQMIYDEWGEPRESK
jgi:ABC-type Na+ transport system ATPase subunit NatA